jgi:hypothetical protein
MELRAGPLSPQSAAGRCSGRPNLGGTTWETPRPKARGLCPYRREEVIEMTEDDTGTVSRRRVAGNPVTFEEGRDV